MSCLLAFSLLTAPDVSTAQTFSRDGNRWYEVEISIFRQAAMPAEYPEVTVPGQIQPGYPDRIRRLRTPLDALAFDFSADDGPAFPRQASEAGSNRLAVETLSLNPRATVITGPAPAVTEGDFKLPDPVSDPFLHIAEHISGFERHNQRLRRSGEHRLLYHAVWRQPVLNRSQAEAVLITGGDRFGEHHELEGSVMLSFNVNRIDVDARLWVATFRQEDRRGREERRSGDRSPVRSFEEASGEPVFVLPPLPFESAASTTVAPRPVDVYRVTGLGYMEETRSMVSNQLHYLDHPDMGMLIEVRPYLLPDPLGTD